MNFKERENPDTKVTVMPRSAPYVLIQTLALQKMFTYTDLCSDEVGWLGTATREGNEIQITDVFLFGQEVHATTTEITPEGLESFATELLEKPGGVEIWNNMKVWGHSHVNMGITPSGQDDKQMEEFANIGHDWFIRLICNKKGELSVDVYDYAVGLTFKNVAWERLVSAEEEEILMQIAAMEQQLEVMSGAGLTELTPLIKEEMALKVHKKTYVATTPTSYTSYSRPGTSYANAYGRYHKNKWTTWVSTPPTREEMYKYEDDIPVAIWKKCIDEYNMGVLPATKEKESKPTINIIHEDEDVYKFFDTTELTTLAWSVDVSDLELQMVDYGYEDQFTEADLRAIFRIAVGEAKNTSWGNSYYDASLGY